MAMENSPALFPMLSHATAMLDACHGADVVLVLTEWTESRTLDPAQLGTVVRHKSIIDGRNCLEPATWRAAGWSYRALGRPHGRP